MWVTRRVRERVALLQEVRLLADAKLERSPQDVDELDVRRERVELLARARSGRDVRLGDMEAPLVAGREQQVLCVAQRQ